MHLIYCKVADPDQWIQINIFAPKDPCLLWPWLIECGQNKLMHFPCFLTPQKNVLQSSPITTKSTKGFSTVWQHSWYDHQCCQDSCQHFIINIPELGNCTFFLAYILKNDLGLLDIKREQTKMVFPIFQIKVFRTGREKQPTFDCNKGLTPVRQDIALHATVEPESRNLAAQLPANHADGMAGKKHESS